jgi:type I restriction enzyme S subunit
MDLKNLDLPIDWQIKPLGEAYNFTKKPRGLALNGNGKVPFLPMDSIPIGRIFVNEFQERSASSLTSGTYVENGDLLLAKITPSFENGKQAIVDWNHPFGFATTEVIPIQEKPGVSDKYFLFHLLLHPAIRADLAGKMDGTTGRQRLSKEVLGSCLIPVPPLPEQRKIAAVLGLVQRAIEQQERLIALTTELKKALLHKLFTEGLRGEPQKQTEIGPVPESWEVVPLKDCAVVQTGVAKGRKLDGKDTFTLPYLRVANVQSGFLDLREMKTITIQTKEKSRYLLRNGDIVLTEGGDFDKLGRGFIWKGEVDDCVHQNHIFAVRVDRSRLLPEFFAHLSQSPYGKKYFLSVAHKTTNLACINTTKLKGFPVLVPMLEEQREIVGALAAMDAQASLHQRKRQSLSDLFRTLLHQLMTTQIRLYDVDLSILPVLD